MLPLSELLKTAGNVLLLPAELDRVRGLWQRALLLGSSSPEVIAAATQELRVRSPQLVVDTQRQRGQRYDLVVLLLTGEGRSREKLSALRSGASLLLARGREGQWYELRLPAWQPGSLRWWARLVLTGLLSTLYLLMMGAVYLSDLLWRLLPGPRPLPDPGPPRGRRVTFIVPTYNRRELMDSCLPALLAEAGDRHRVIVVDDAGSDGTREYVQERYPAVKLIRLERNLGFAGAVKAGIAASDTPLFALINDDAQVRPGFLETMLLAFDQEDVFAVCSRIDLADGSQVETGKVAAAFSGILEPYHVAPDGPGPILYAGGASSIFHRARFDALGGFEAMYHPFYWEDIELGYRAWRRGWRSVFAPDASVLHRRRATIGPRFGDAYADQTFLKNALLFTWKNLRDQSLLTQHFVYVVARLAREVPSGVNMMSGAILRALPLLPRALLRRWQVQRRGDLGDREIMALLEPLRTQWPENASGGPGKARPTGRRGRCPRPSGEAK